VWYYWLLNGKDKSTVYSNELTFQTGEKERLEIVFVDARPGAAQGAARERPGAVQSAARDQELEEEEEEEVELPNTAFFQK
jgi:hypothetical protein